MPALFESQAYRSAKMLAAMDVVGDAAWALWSRAILWSNEESTDGFVPTSQLRHLTSHSDPVSVAEALCDAGLALRKSGLFERTPGGYLIHDFLAHNFSKAEKDAKKQRDRERKGPKAPQGPPPDAPSAATDNGHRPRGDLSESAPAPIGIHAETSTRIPDGIPPDSGSITKQNKAKHSTAEEERASAPAATPLPVLSELGEKILAAAAKLPRVGPLVDPWYANELGLIADRLGKAPLVGKALEEADGKLTADGGPVNVGQGRDVIQKYIRNVRPERAGPTRRGPTHLQPTGGVDWESKAAPPPRIT